MEGPEPSPGPCASPSPGPCAEPSPERGICPITPSRRTCTRDAGLLNATDASTGARIMRKPKRRPNSDRWLGNLLRATSMLREATVSLESTSTIVM